MKHIFRPARRDLLLLQRHRLGRRHSYIVYGPLMHGMSTILYEGLPVRPDAGIWWKLVARHRVTAMFASPTAIRVLKKQDPQHLKGHDLSSLRSLFLAGEPLDEPTATWIADAIGKPIVDNYWQTESGWPILTLARGIDATMAARFGSPGFPMPGFDVRLVDETTGADIVEPGRKGVVVLEQPTPPGFMQTVWRDDDRFVDTYWRTVPGRAVYSTFDWGIRDADGYWFILGRTDDVINVAGHRLGTREIEESISSHPNVAEVAVVGVTDALKGQVAIAFVIARDAAALVDVPARLRLEGDVMKTVDSQLGSLARPARVHFVAMLPKTRSGKLLRRALQAIAEGRDPGDLTTIEDPAALQQIRDVLAAGQTA
jgi:propionyl-CoA synthetase